MNFVTEKQFAADLVGQFPVSQDGTHVSVIRFSNSARTQVISHLGDVTDPATLRNIILNVSNNDSSRSFDRGSATHHKDAMILARQQLNERGRNGATKIIVLITDGIPMEEGSSIVGSASQQSARNESDLARAEGVQIFCVGVFPMGGSLEANARSELNYIAGNSSRVSVVGEFSQLNSTLTGLITEEICNDGKETVIL